MVTRGQVICLVTGRRKRRKGEEQKKDIKGENLS